jgi:SagB-type dehydrogenase family enzyme
MEEIVLPKPKGLKGESLWQLLRMRRTVRSFLRKDVSVEELSYLLWACYGVKEDGGRTVPSAGALYPNDVYVIEEKGVYRYLPERHVLRIIKRGDVRRELARASLSQMWMAEAPVTVCITCEFGRITFKYRERGIRYAYIEAGEIAQNLFLAAFELSLGCGIVGAFDDEAVQEIMGIERTHEPILLMPIGHMRG